MEANLSNLISSRFRPPQQMMPATNHMQQNHDDKASHHRKMADTVSISQQAQFSYSQQQSTQSSIEITTRDGDKVTISLSEKSAYQSSFSYSEIQSQQMRQTQITTSASQQSSLQYQFSVEGNLDKDERAAIEELVHDISKVADKLYQGNVDPAFAQASSLQYDSAELSSYAFNFTQTNSRQYTAAYQQVAQLQTETSAAPVSSLGIIDLMDSLRVLAENAIKDLKDLFESDQIQSLMAQAAALMHDKHNSKSDSEQRTFHKRRA